MGLNGMWVHPKCGWHHLIGLGAIEKKEQGLLGMQLYFLNRCVSCSSPHGHQTPASSVLDDELVLATLRPSSWPTSLVSLDLKLPASWVTNSRGYWFLWWPRTATRDYPVLDCISRPIKLLVESHMHSVGSGPSK